MEDPNLSARSKAILKSLVELYIAHGLPVGSKTIANLPNIQGSSATIRNAMADLEKSGLIHAPHTSAGRVPTKKGYQFFANSLLTVAPLEDSVIESIQEEMDPGASTQQIVAKANAALSSFTKLAGIVTTPKQNHLNLTHFELVRISSERLLVIMVYDNGDVQNRIILCSEAFSQRDLEQASAFLTQLAQGKTLEALRRTFIEQLESQRADIDQKMRGFIEMAATTVDKMPKQPDYIVSGKSHLVDQLNDEGVLSLKQLFDTFNQKQTMLNLLDQCMQSDGVHIYLGAASDYAPLGDFGLITSPYQLDDDTVGLIGVIGPSRMAYDRVVPLVDMTSKILSMTLEKNN